jgi:hypothetical protein
MAQRPKDKDKDKDRDDKDGQLKSLRSFRNSMSKQSRDDGDDGNVIRTVQETTIAGDKGNGKPTVTTSSFLNTMTSLKRSRSQVFDDSHSDQDKDKDNEHCNDENNNHMTEQVQQARRKSSWAFWKSDTENDGELDTQTSPNPVIRTDNPADSEALPENQTQTSNPNPTPKQSQAVDVKTIDGASSWSFWSAALQENRNRPLASSDDIPDVVKSDVKSNTNGKRRSTTGIGIAPTRVTSIITPSFEETLPLATTQTTILNGFKRVRKLLGYGTEEKELYLYRKLTPTPFKRALIIGVHGFFPTRMIRPIIGEPTGTSMKFAQVGEESVLAWAREEGLNIEIQKIALEKEGKILERVDFFFDILKKSKDDIQKADFIFVCAHSQGCPVSIILMSKLLEYGIIDESKKVSILGMAGVNIGPFFGMDKSLFIRAYSTIENESMLELFQFQNFESLQSRKYIDSLKKLMKHDVKITFVGSIDDQLVPLYSAIALHVQHPNIFKAVYIDKSTNTPSFVARIIKLSCMLTNLGSTDHDVIKEISSALAGPITGGGHSKIYNDPQVYRLALDFALKTESSPLAIEQNVKFKPFDITKLGSGSNPFNLPWCARGLFFEVSRRLNGDGRGTEEIDAVFQEFDEWEPASKALKDVKYRLNGIRAKL